MQTLQNNQAYVGIGLAALIVIFVWWMISLKVKREVIKYGEGQIRNPRDGQRETIVNTATPTVASEGNNEGRGGVQDSDVKELEQYLGDTIQPVGGTQEQHEASESSSETTTLTDGASSIPKPAEFEEI